jgi:hypothetical protein
MNPRHHYISPSFSSDRNDPFYKECTEVLPHIAEKIFHRQIKISPDCTPPSEYGLVNSDQIIPDYYFTGKDLRGKLFECDFFYGIQDSIRNMRILNKYQEKYIENLDKEDCYQLLKEYNSVMATVNEYIMSDSEDTISSVSYKKM